MTKPLLKRWWLPVLSTGLLIAFPWIVQILLIPCLGLLPGVKLLNWYYTPPAFLFGDELFPAGQFGIYPEGSTSKAIAATLYGGVGLIVGLAMPRSSRST